MQGMLRVLSVVWFLRCAKGVKEFPLPSGLLCDKSMEQSVLDSVCPVVDASQPEKMQTCNDTVKLVLQCWEFQSGCPGAPPVNASLQKEAHDKVCNYVTTQSYLGAELAEAICTAHGEWGLALMACESLVTGFLGGLLMDCENIRVTRDTVLAQSLEMANDAGLSDVVFPTLI
uniref:Uncharacterized protein n=1 Tax=Noctiluca scintillans TaxID=2966 RepID=A0A7S1AFM9_NOCSC|mmetsp:Transcript_43972/g.116264  ORF Transcript_43972/g.116264 Transcript_43972/m.116264 type:complete len:173 (+) Transcript_43972:55-573(+)